MTKKSKKTKSKKPAVKRKAHARNYEAHYLGVILISFLLLEGCLFGITQASDWSDSFVILDVSGAVTETYSDLSIVFQPITDAVAGVNEFYQLSATAMTELVDLSSTEPTSELTLVTEGVYSFYEQASGQLASLLDMSEVSSWPSTVAGASVTAD